MKAAWLTDIHLNFLKFNQVDDFFRKLSKEPVDYFLMSGDIGEADTVVDYLKVADTTLKRPFYFVLGNHDFYKGSLKMVWSAVSELTKTSDNLIWLNEAEYIPLTEETALVGHDSWADGRLGDYHWSDVELNDFRLVDELRLWNRAERLKAMQELADEAVDHFKKILPKALENHRKVIVLTHVPPFKEATWHQGKTSDDDWLPFFSCKVVGDVLRDIMEQHPSCEMTVLCGHCHSSGECQILPNVMVIIGLAECRSPRIQSIIEVQ